MPLRTANGLQQDVVIWYSSLADLVCSRTDRWRWMDRHACVRLVPLLLQGARIGVMRETIDMSSANVEVMQLFSDALANMSSLGAALPLLMLALRQPKVQCA